MSNLYNDSDQFGKIYVDVLDPEKPAVPTHARKHLDPYVERVVESVDNNNAIDFSEVDGSTTAEKVTEFVPWSSKRVEIEIGGHVLAIYLVPPSKASQTPDPVPQRVERVRRVFG